MSTSTAPQSTPAQSESATPQAASGSSESETGSDDSSSKSDSQSSESGHAEPLGVTTSTNGQDNTASDGNNQGNTVSPLVMGIIAAGTVAAGAAVGLMKSQSEE